VPKLIQRLWLPTLISLCVLLSAGFTMNAIRDAGMKEEITEAAFVRPLGYVALAPISDTFDTLTLLSVRQHIAFVLGAFVLFALYRVVRARLGAPTWRSHLTSAATFIVVLLAVYAGVAMLPRPMARLEAANANILLVDFHSHTMASHDGRSGWSAEKNRRWHEHAGFDVAYITDHGVVSEAERGMAANPSTASDSTILLQGIEVTWTGEHVTILGAERMYKGLLTPNKRDVDEQALQLASLLSGREPVVIWNHPRDLSHLPLAKTTGAGVRAIEIINGAPDGMDVVRPKRASIIAAAQRGDLVLTAGSDNHGWGRTAPGWTMLLVPGWRGMSADSLDYNIQRQLRSGIFRTSRAVERTPSSAETPLELGATVFLAPLTMLRTMSMDERLVWLLWTWAITIGVVVWRRRAMSS
jgi:hypothetical protein